MGDFQNLISKCSEREQNYLFKFFFIGASASKSFQRSRFFRYGLFKDILKKPVRLDLDNSYICMNIMKVNLITLLRVKSKEKYNSTVCPRSLDPFHKVTYYMRRVKTFWTYSSIYFIIFGSNHGCIQGRG